MKLKTASKTLVLLATASALGTGCASIVKKPEINQVKRVAVLSVYANASVPDLRGRGIVGGAGWDDSMRLSVAENALNSFEKHFEKMGWQVVPANAVITSKEYIDAFSPKTETATSNQTVNRMLAFAAAVNETRTRAKTFSPPGMHPVYLESKEGNTTYYGDAAKDNPKAKLADMAKKLKVDAVVLSYIDYCYQSGAMAIAGTGEAEITAGTTVKMVNTKGDIVADLGEIERCKGGSRGVSKNTIAQHQGKLLLGLTDKKKVVNMFEQATDASYQQSFARLSEAMK